MKTIRAVELLLAISVPDETLNFKLPSTNFTDVLTVAASSSGDNIFTDEIRSVLKDAVPILVEVGLQLGVSAIFNSPHPSSLVHVQRSPLITKYVLLTKSLFYPSSQWACSFMDINWQHNNPANPADAAIGPQGYDNHLYYSFGVSADTATVLISC